MKEPVFSKCVRVRVEYILEFDKNAHLPMELVDKASAFIRAGVLALFPRATIKKKYGDLHVVLGVNTEMTHLREQDLERRRKKFITWAKGLDIPDVGKKALIESAMRVGKR